jgi:hypothetical protein
MANTYSQIYIQIVFVVKGRENLLLKPWRDTVFKYISGIIKAKKTKSYHCKWNSKPCSCISRVKTRYVDIRFSKRYKK